MHVRLLKTIIFFILALSFSFANASDKALEWKDGIQVLHEASFYESVEKFAVYMESGDISGPWRFPEELSSTENRVNLTANSLVEWLDNFRDINDLKKDSPIKFVLAHTHPRQTIVKQISEVHGDAASSCLVKCIIDYDGLLSLPPSRLDLEAIFILDSAFKQKGYKNVEVWGLVVTPSGNYTHRLFKSVYERNKMFPEVSNQTPYTYLDLDDQIQRDKEMSDELFLVSTEWVKSINEVQGSDEHESLLKSDIYRKLQVTYASFGIGAILYYYPGEDLQATSAQFAEAK